MATTIQVSDLTRQILEHIKEEENAESYDAIIYELVKNRQKVPSSLFGKGRGKGWKPDDRMKFHGE